MSKFFSEWKENREKAYKNRSFLSKFSDYIVLILIVFLGISFVYQSITKPSDTTYKPSTEVSTVVNKDNNIQTPTTTTQNDTPKTQVFNLFHISIIDIVIVVVAAGAYCYIKFWKNKREKEGDR